MGNKEKLGIFNEIGVDVVFDKEFLPCHFDGKLFVHCGPALKRKRGEWNPSLI